MISAAHSFFALMFFNDSQGIFVNLSIRRMQAPIGRCQILLRH